MWKIYYLVKNRLLLCTKNILVYVHNCRYQTRYQHINIKNEENEKNKKMKPIWNGGNENIKKIKSKRKQI